MTNHIINIISNIKAIGWVTILVFSGILYYSIYSLITAYLVTQVQNSMLIPSDMNNPDMVEMTELITQLSLLFIALSIISVIGILIGRGLLRIKKWATNGFHVLSISIGMLIIIGVVYLVVQLHSMPSNQFGINHNGMKLQTISLGTLGLLITWLITKVNILLFRKEYRIEMN